MKRSRALLAALVVLFVWIAGCSSGHPPNEKEIKAAFINQLIGFCAEVDRKLEGIDPKVQPGIWADQLKLFVNQARRQPPPALDREQFEMMLTKIDNTVGQYRSAQAALITDHRSKADRAVKQAGQQLAKADAAAQKYGMPPLKTLPSTRVGDVATRTRPGRSVRSRCGVAAAARGGGGGAAG